MNSVHSEGLGVTITGNTITHHNVLRKNIIYFIGSRDQVSLLKTTEDGGSSRYDISFAMNSADHLEFAGLIHRLNSENKMKEKVDKGGPSPDNDGPKPTNPRGSGGKVVEFENTLAIAA